MNNTMGQCIVDYREGIFAVKCNYSMGIQGKWVQVVSGIAFTAVIIVMLLGGPAYVQASEGTESLSESTQTTELESSAEVEAVTERARVTTELESGPFMGEVNDPSHAKNYIQQTRQGGIAALSLKEDQAANVLQVTYGQWDSSLQQQWQQESTLPLAAGATPAKGVQRETYSGGQLWLISYMKAESGAEWLAVHTAADGQVLWSRPLETDGMATGQENASLGLEPLPQGDFLVYTIDQQRTLTTYHYNRDGELDWTRRTGGVETGWLIAADDGYYSILNTDRGVKSVLSDVYGQPKRNQVWNGWGKRRVLDVHEWKDGIAVTVTGKSQASAKKRTLIFDHQMKKRSDTGDYDANLYYIPEDGAFLSVSDQYEAMGGKGNMSMHGITITSLNRKGKELWSTNTVYKEDDYFRVTLDGSLFYKTPEGYVILSRTESNGATAVMLDLMKILVHK
ncbi:hypothetical protein [Paenibacillus sp. FSL K6-1230]|uniref:hypothetical protein n=1 Tax=Paenibacillus sp. FSL K6-1230 TaxID=2921603 RepID=UPI0003A04021